MLANVVFVPVSLSKDEDAELSQKQNDEEKDNTYPRKGENLGLRKINNFFVCACVCVWKERPTPKVLI